MGRYSSSSDVYNKTGLTGSEVGSPAIDYFILEAEREVDLFTGRIWSGSVYANEFYDGPTKDVFGNKKTWILVRNYPILAIGSFNRIDASTGSLYTAYSGLSASDIASGIYKNNQISVIPTIGKIQLVSDELYPGTMNYQVYYSFGMTGTAVPQEVRCITECIAGIRAWVNVLGGRYSWVNSYSVPETSVNKGDLYQRGQMMIENLRKEADDLLDKVGIRMRTLFAVTGGESTL